MAHRVSILLPSGCKRRVDHDTYSAIKRAIRIYDCDSRVRAYAAGPGEDIDEDLIAAIRARMVKTGELSLSSYSRRRELT